MENKIQQLTEQLYNEGVARGEQESEQLIAAAKIQAAKILEEANKSAAQIVDDAKNAAEDLNIKGISDLRRAASELVADVKSQVEKAVVAKSIGNDVKAAFSNENFVNELIVASVKAWGEKSDMPIMVNVTEGKEAETENFIKSKVDSALTEKITVCLSSKVKNGFTVAPQGEGYYISFTAEDFDALLSDYLRSKVAAILF